MAKLTGAEFLETVKVLADPALRASLEKLAEPASLDALKGARDLQDAVKTLGSPELAAALERFNSPAVQGALRKASAALLPRQGHA
ncbi:hypothetical protein HQ576_19225 [bacterium]|nr:hypothetical protein [bacterium]